MRHGYLHRVVARAVDRGLRQALAFSSEDDRELPQERRALSSSEMDSSDRAIAATLNPQVVKERNPSPPKTERFRSASREPGTPSPSTREQRQQAVVFVGVSEDRVDAQVR